MADEWKMDVAFALLRVAEGAVDGAAEMDVALLRVADGAVDGAAVAVAPPAPVVSIICVLLSCCV